jgi:hypothetical protein
MSKQIIKSPAIAVIGHLVKDEIVTIDGKSRISLGGTAYNLAALSAIQETGKIYPVCRIGLDIKKMTDHLFGLSIKFDLSGVCYARRPNAVHRLTYRLDGSRDEWNSGKQMPLSMDSVLDKCDAVMLNFISGNDVRLNDLFEFRKRYYGLIYCDFHSLSLGYGADHRRFLRHHRRWREYVSMADIIQMNIVELSSIVGRSLDSRKAAMKALTLLHQAGPDVAIVTAGRDGIVFSQRSEKRIYHIPAVSIGREVDATGCGDTLSASFLYHYLSSGDIIKSLETANRYAAAKATFSGIDCFGKIDKIIENIGPPTTAERVFGLPF